MDLLPDFRPERNELNARLLTIFTNLRTERNAEHSEIKWERVAKSAIEWDIIKVILCKGINN